MKKLILSTATVLILSTGMVYASGENSSHWGYEGHGGPENWGKLSPEYATCGTGKAQSPIDISGQSGDTDAIKTFYNETPVNILNNGHTIQLNFAAGSRLQSAGQDYKLLQLHFHSSSEHTIDGKSYPLEMHLVHQSADGTLAVVGVMFEKGAENTELAKIWDNMPEKAGGVITSENTVDVNKLIPDMRTYTRYDGSLTTPPCSEGVKWHVLTTPLEMSEDQVGKFLSTVHKNNRPVQPLNGRKLLEYKQ